MFTIVEDFVLHACHFASNMTGHMMCVSCRDDSATSIYMIIMYSCKFLLSSKILTYIQKHGLYETQATKLF